MCLMLQKRWNVYGRENRLKVIQDEAKYEEEQAAVRERAEQADRERRRDLLKERARRRYKGVRACLARAVLARDRSSRQAMVQPCCLPCERCAL